jgi:predicted DNA-binding transcriptional regulator AlpA
VRGGLSERLLTARDVADWLGFAPGTIPNWWERDELPGFRLPNGRVRFRRGDVEAWLEEGRRGPDVRQPATLRGWTTQRTHSTIHAVHNERVKGTPSA